MNIPSTLPAGDSASWTNEPFPLPDSRQASPVTGWALQYLLRGPVRVDITAVSDGGAGWRSTLTASASAAMTPGTYFWAATITKADERLTVRTGELLVTPNLAIGNDAFDGRSVAARALSDCEAAMATFNRTGGKVKKYEIAGRTMEFQTISDLLTLHSFWKAKVMSEGAAQSIANGGGNPRNLYMRFVPVQ